MCVPRFVDCDNKGDDRGVTLSYNYNLAEVTDDYGGDYDNQISSCEMRSRSRNRERGRANTFHREMLRPRDTHATCQAETRALVCPLHRPQNLWTFVSLHSCHLSLFY